MAVAIPFIMVAGAALSAYGAVQSAQAQKTAAQYNAALNERNATIAHQQAEADAQMQERRARQVHGSIVAGYGAAGVEGESMLDVLSMSAQQAALDESTIRYRGNLKAMGYHDNAALDRMAGETAERQGYLNAASSFLMGMGQAGATYAAGARRIPGTQAYTGPIGNL